MVTKEADLEAAVEVEAVEDSEGVADSGVDLEVVEDKEVRI